MSDPFQDAHRRAAEKVKKDDAARQIVARDQRVANTAVQRAQAARPEKPYPWPKKFFDFT